jgi:hypothetical protein
MEQVADKEWEAHVRYLYPFGIKGKALTFIGYHTIWRDELTGRRPGTMMESALCDYMWVTQREKEHLDKLLKPL